MLLTSLQKFTQKCINPLKCSASDGYIYKSGQCHQGLTYIFNFWHSGTLALTAERQSAQMSEIKNGSLDLNGQV